jgi:Fe-S-cluster containining protein
MKRAAEGDDFARGFFSIMMPYSNHDEARKVVPGLVERTLNAAKKLDDFQNPEQDIVFYHCRYLQPDNKCGVHEDRPQFCRDYPDTPFVVMAPGCAFEPWAAACKSKYNEMKAEVKKLTGLKAELDQLKNQQKSAMTAVEEQIIALDKTYEGLSLVLSLTNLYLASPMQSFLLLRF